jgi:hypothetical protein
VLDDKVDNVPFQAEASHDAAPLCGGEVRGRHAAAVDVAGTPTVTVRAAAAGGEDDESDACGAESRMVCLPALLPTPHLCLQHPHVVSSSPNSILLLDL